MYILRYRKTFIKNLTNQQIIEQIHYVLKDQNISSTDIKKFQIMFMSMGEPMLNWKEVRKSIYMLNSTYKNAQLLLSTIGIADDEVFEDIVRTSIDIDKVGLQFSIHKASESERDILIPYKKKYTLRQIRDRATIWQQATDRKVYLNYCVDNSNSRSLDENRLKDLFSPVTFNMTFSVICEADETMKDVACTNRDAIKRFEQAFINDGYNTRIFDLAGQDDIGASCGQLFETQRFFKNKKDKK